MNQHQDNAVNSTSALNAVSSNSGVTHTPMQYVSEYGIYSLTRFGPRTYYMRFTANGKWSEIERMLEYRQTIHDRTDLVRRVFYIKFQDMVAELMKRGFIINIYTIEFQNRGLPHGHLIFTIVVENIPRNPTTNVSIIDLFVAIRNKICKNLYPISKQHNDTNVAQHEIVPYKEKRVVPYNPALMLAYKSNLKMVVATFPISVPVKYLYKYNCNQVS